MLRSFILPYTTFCLPYPLLPFSRAMYNVEESTVQLFKGKYLKEVKKHVMTGARFEEVEACRSISMEGRCCFESSM